MQALTAKARQLFEGVMDPELLNQRRIAVGAIVAASVLIHGLLLLNDGVYWDGWLIYAKLQDKDWSTLYQLYHELGVPTFAYFHWLMGYLPYTIFCYKLVAFLSITCSAILVYMICEESRLTNRLGSLLIALLSLSYPAFQASTELCLLPYMVFYSVFLLACFLAMKSERMTGLSRYVLHVVALALWLLSFSSSALLVFYYGFLLVLVLLVRQNEGLSVKNLLTRFLLRRLDYVFLPILYWFVMRHFFPPHGHYATFNQFSLSILGVAWYYVDFLWHSVCAQVDVALGRLLHHPAALVFVLLTLLWLSRTFHLHSIRLSERKTSFYGALLVGVALLLLAILPCAVTLKPLSTSGYWTHYFLLVGLPMAVILISIVQLCLGNARGAISRFGLFFLAILFVAFSLSTWAYYFSWQGRWVKDRSIIENLRATDSASQVSVFWVDDRFQMGQEEGYRFFEWSSLLSTVWKDESHIGLDQRLFTPDFLTEGLPYFNDRYELSSFDPAGCQAVLTIRPGPNSSENAVVLSLRYFYHKFCRPSTLETFLNGVTELEVTPVSAPEAVDCIEAP